MTVRPVHWHEGMFLWPQQMQQAERFVAEQVFLNGKWDTHYNWGLRWLALDLTALSNARFVVQGLQARLRDGSLLAMPEDVNLPVLDLKESFAQGPSVTVFLAVPRARLGKANAAERLSAKAPGPAPSDDDQGEPRYWVESQNLEDENTGEDSQAIAVRRFNAKLLLSTQNQSGYEVLPVARIKKAPQADAKPELDAVYIPPLLACDAWKPLRDGILQSVYDRFGRNIAKLSAQIVTRGISFDTRNPGDALFLAQLQSLNEAYAYLRVLAFAEGIHPLPAYLELCRLAGKLAVFAKAGPQAPTLPHYDHDDLGGCFYKLKQYLDSIELFEPIYEDRPFIGEAARMQVVLEAKWLEPRWDMYVGVHSPLRADECIRLLTRPGELDMKIGSSSRVDEIYSKGMAGLKFTPSPTPPRALPAQPDLVYFQVSRDSQRGEWQSVQQSLTLAIRLNSKRIVGNIQGQHQLTIDTGRQKTTMQFTLYLTPRET